LSGPIPKADRRLVDVVTDAATITNH
jgi:hypothetical protein